MSSIFVGNPFSIFTDVDGDPLDDGYIYVGTAGLNAETNQIQAYWDSALTILAAQPIRTIDGYPANNGAAARIYVDATDFSIFVKNKKGILVFSVLSNPSIITVNNTAVTVENKAALKALPIYGSAVNMLGRSSIADGGEGDFAWVAADVSADAALDSQEGVFVAKTGTPTTTGAFKRQRIRQIKAEWFGANPNATAANNVIALQAAVNLWANADYAADLVLPAGSCSVNAAIALTTTANISKQKRIIGYGGKLLSTSAGYALDFALGAGLFWRGLKIEGIQIDGGVGGIRLNGGDYNNPAVGAGTYMYGIVLRDCMVENFTGTGYEFKNNVFEAQYENLIAWADPLNVTGYGIHRNAGINSVSSDFYINCNTRNGLHGLYAPSGGDTKVWGGTYLVAYNEGIKLLSCLGAVVSDAHVEANYTVGGSVTGAAGLKMTGNGSIRDVTGSTTDAADQLYVVNAFATGGVINVTGSRILGATTKYGYFQTATDGAILCQGLPSFDVVAGSRIEELGVDGAVSNSLAQKQQFFAYAATVTPNLNAGSWVNVGALTGDITIANPTSGLTVRSGSLLGIRLIQDATGGRLVSWGSQFIVSSSVNHAPSKSTEWLFRWNGTGWQQIGHGSDGALVLPTTTAKSLLRKDGNLITTNDAATARVDITLPAASLGAGPFTFSCLDADGIRAIAIGTDVIRFAATVSAAAGRLDSTTIGDVATLVCTKTGVWQVTSVVGAGWSVT